MSYLIYLVEDELNLNQLLVSYLEQEAWRVRPFQTGEEAREALAGDEQPHLWVLDIMLPGVDGYQLIREIKAKASEVPVIFISARDAELDRVVGLEMGSDDYLPKPFSPRELVIRIRLLLGRIYGDKPKPEREGWDFAPYRIYEAQRLVKERDAAIELTSKELDVVLFFCRHAGQAFSREQLLRQLWGEDYVGSDRVVDDVIRRVRRKLPQLRLETLYGFGYRLVQG